MNAAVVIRKSTDGKTGKAKYYVEVEWPFRLNSCADYHRYTSIFASKRTVLKYLDIICKAFNLTYEEIHWRGDGDCSPHDNPEGGE